MSFALFTAAAALGIVAAGLFLWLWSYACDADSEAAPPRCPGCGSRYVVPSSPGGAWHCRQCGDNWEDRT